VLHSPPRSLMGDIVLEGRQYRVVCYISCFTFIQCAGALTISWRQALLVGRGLPHPTPSDYTPWKPCDASSTLPPYHCPFPSQTSPPPPTTDGANTSSSHILAARFSSRPIARQEGRAGQPPSLAALPPRQSERSPTGKCLASLRTPPPRRRGVFRSGHHPPITCLRTLLLAPPWWPPEELSRSTSVFSLFLMCGLPLLLRPPHPLPLRKKNELPAFHSTVPQFL
jgi:hypothetical protein